MFNKLNFLAFFLICTPAAKGFELSKDQSSGTFSLGTRNTMSFFNHDESAGMGIGGQFRIQLTDRLNTEWYYDWITSKNQGFTFRNDHHIGWSLMFYPSSRADFGAFLKPYLIAGHCFDYRRVAEQENESNFAEAMSMATQAGIGTHLNITPRFDCSISAQYMLHFGKEIHTETGGDIVSIQKEKYSVPDGHLLFTVSFNYKFFNLWKG